MYIGTGGKGSYRGKRIKFANKSELTDKLRKKVRPVYAKVCSAQLGHKRIPVYNYNVCILYMHAHHTLHGLPGGYRWVSDGAAVSGGAGRWVSVGIGRGGGVGRYATVGIGWCGGTRRSGRAAVRLSAGRQLVPWLAGLLHH